MKKLFSPVFIGLLATHLLAPLAQAQGQGGKVYAVLAGISKYKDPQIKERVNAEKDVLALHALLSKQGVLGLSKENTRLLLGNPAQAGDAGKDAAPATKANILEGLKFLVSKAGPNDLVLFAFIGEGGPLRDSGDQRCYFTSDSTFQGREKNALASSEILDVLKNLKSNQFCAFIDINFKGFLAQGKSVAEVTLGQNPYQEFFGEDEGEDSSPVQGRAVFLATNGLTQSLDLENQGIFTQSLLNGLKGAADKDGYEPDGIVTVDELAEYLDKEIPELARKNGKTREEKNQMHWALGGRINHFGICRNPGPYSQSQARLSKFEKLAGDGKLSKEMVQEGKTYLAQMPRLEAQRNLRKEYQALADGKSTYDQFETKRKEILEQTKLGQGKADAFSKTVLKAIEAIRKGYVKDVNPGEMAAWGIRGLFRRIEEKIPGAIGDKLKSPKELKEKDILEVLAAARMHLGKREDLDKGKDIDITLQRMLSHLDPYTTYIDAETKANFDRDVQGNFTGIGVQIRKDSNTDMLLVVTPIKNSPAYKAGVMAGDIITTVIREVDSEGKKLPEQEVISTKGMQLSDAVKKILGRANTKVKIVVKREGEEKPLEFEITRGRVEVETVLGFQRNKDDDWNYMIDPKSKIGYVRLTSFSRNTARDLLKIMRELVGKGVKGFVLDLRFNPGGLLDSAVDISDLFIDDGLIVSIRPRAGRESKHTGIHEGSLLEFPMVCLVNGGSASGSEIVSAALQDHHRALIVGERSYGKGSVQNIQPFGDGELKLTIASFWRPNGKNLNKSSTGGKDEDEWGVKPDLEIKLSRKERDDLMEHHREIEIIHKKIPSGTPGEKKEFKDKQLDEALNYLRENISTAKESPAKKAG
ncbi:MAG: S41 family peptidase [Gemmataceae bacterium]|nr:S41 family peptidase [Gemmataceae bacterium]